MSRIPFLILVILVADAPAQDVLTPRASDAPVGGPYIPLDIGAVANDSKGGVFPAERVQIRNIPFNLLKPGAPNHLFLKPIGWNAWKDESNEYPQYIANYDNRLANTNNPARALLRVPVADYAAIWLLAAADNDPALADIVTFRLGILDGQTRTAYHDFVATIPRAKETQPANAVPIPASAGNLFLVRVPIGKIIAQDLREPPSRIVDPNRTAPAFLDLDITKELRTVINLPDPNRFQLRPLGLSSGVRIYGLTLERSPVEASVTGAQAGNVFNEPQTPSFRLDLQNARGESAKYSLRTIVQSHDGTIRTNAHVEVKLAPGEAIRKIIEVPATQRGHYEIMIQLLSVNQLVASRETSFALLAPDTRKHRNESPFGVWDFGGVHFTPDDADVVGPLYVKAGLGYGMMQWIYPESKRKQYGVLDGQDNRISSTNDVKAIQERTAKDPTQQMSLSPPKRFLTFHETSISGPHLTRTPDVFTGRPPYSFNAAEEKQFQAMWKEAEESFRAIRAAYPDAEIYFGNGVPHVIEEFARRKFPRELLSAAGNESGSFMRPPETQPLDFVANNSGLWMFRQILDRYGYADVPLRQCVETGYPGSNTGNLSERTQAAYLVRHLMHSLAWKIPVIRPMCLSDMGNSYYNSNWGATGILHAWPNLSPKQVYVAFAVLTQALDGATFQRAVPTGSCVVYAFEFQLKDRKCVTCIWTPRGRRSLTIEAPRATKEKLTDMMGRETGVEFKEQKAQVEISSAPVYLATPAPLASITPGVPQHEGRPAGRSFTISALGNLSDWKVESERSTELETYNFMNPRRKGDFAFREVESFEGEKEVIEVKPRLPVEGSVDLQMYSVLSHLKTAEIPGEPTEIGLMINGNGGWGRAIFELEDGSGQRWISIGAEQPGEPMSWMQSWIGAEAFKKLNPKMMSVSDWNSDDAWGCSYINHDGWRFIRFPLPGQYSGEGYHWPKNSQWRFSGDGVVRYPLKFRKLIITLREKVLYGTQSIAPPRPEIYIKDLMATYEPVEKVFAAQ